MSNLRTVAAKGDQAATLRALRNAVAARMDVCSSDQNYSTMARVLVDVMAAIAVLEHQANVANGTALDELTRRRAAAGRPDSTRRTVTGRPGVTGPGA